MTGPQKPPYVPHVISDERAAAWAERNRESHEAANAADRRAAAAKLSPEIVLAARTLIGASQQDVAAAAMLDVAQVAAVEAGKRGSGAVRLQIVTALEALGAEVRVNGGTVTISRALAPK